MCKKLEAEGKTTELKMWCFQRITCFVILGSLLLMVIEGTYRKGGLYTTLLAIIMIGMSLVVEKFKVGEKQEEEVLE